MSGKADLYITIHPRKKCGVYGHLWCLMTYDIAIATGWAPKWRMAYRAAVGARKAHLAKQASLGRSRA